ncbi:MAG: reductive dehalogenase [Thermoprotei archaeon]|nr:reductive dehalogenase [Thermoprotei archaeon]
MKQEHRAIENLIKGLNTARVIEKETFSRMVRRTLNVREVRPEELPYKVDERRFKAFSSRNTIFSRAYWDPKIAELRKRMIESMKRNMESGTPGYTLVDYALEEAAWLFTGKHKEIRRRARYFMDISGIESEGEAFTKLVKRIALFFGADLVGVTEVDPKWLYAEVKEEMAKYPYVIVMAFEMDLKALKTANEGPYAGEVGLSYSKMSIVSAHLAYFLRYLGFKAIPQGNEGALSVPLAVLAGLGEVGRSGLLITPEYGPRVRLAKVFTDAPLLPDKPIRFGVWEFCRECQLCAIACPAKAIPYGGPSWDGPTVSEEKGVYKWHVNHERCYAYWSQIGRGCGLCLKVCPYSNTLWDVHRIRALKEALRMTADHM